MKKSLNIKSSSNFIGFGYLVGFKWWGWFLMQLVNWHILAWPRTRGLHLAANSVWPWLSLLQRSLLSIPLLIHLALSLLWLTTSHWVPFGSPLGSSHLLPKTWNSSRLSNLLLLKFYFTESFSFTTLCSLHIPIDTL